jgi:hypothetical protein
MTGSESRLLLVNARVIWNAGPKDTGTVIEKDWAGIVIKWDSREKQRILHNDMAMVTRAPSHG